MDDRGYNKTVAAQPQGLFTPYEAAFPVVAPNISTPARKAAVAFENTIRHDALETIAFFDLNGNQYFSRQGKTNVVLVPEHVLLRSRGMTMTHNHPGGAPFSKEDVLNAAIYALGELRVVTAILRFSLQPDRRSGWPLPEQIERLYLACEQESITQASADVRGGALDFRYFGFEVGHRTWQKFAKITGMAYQAEKS